MPIKILRYSEATFQADLAALRDTLRAGRLTGSSTAGGDVRRIVADVIADVEARGDQAVIDLTAKIEKVALTPDRLRVEPQRIAAARQAADAGFLDLLRRAADNIRQYQEAIRFRDPKPLRRGGRSLGLRYTPIDRVGVFVPGGSGSGAVLISSALMTLVPAVVAGVPEIALVSPPTSDGEVSPLVLAVAAELGIAEVYRVSGTAGVAALAIGTQTIRPVQKIVGPGNAFIAEAKRQLFGRVGIDAIAGPSEVLIVADETAPPRYVAADLLAQAEHDPGSAILVTLSEKLVEGVLAEIGIQIDPLERNRVIRAALASYSAIVITENLDDACRIADDFAPEHLQIMTADDEAAMAKIRNAGAIFLGPYTPVPLGDYYAGPSHVLPTGGTAKFFGPLSVNDFLKASSVIRYDEASLAEDARDVVTLAEREGLTAHAEAVKKRQGKS